MGGRYLKYNGGDSGIKISVLYWRCSLIRVSVIRGSTYYCGGGGGGGSSVATLTYIRFRLLQAATINNSTQHNTVIHFRSFPLFVFTIAMQNVNSDQCQ